MEKNKLKSMVLIDFQEYKLLLKKAELYDKLISKPQSELSQEGGSISKIIATQAFNEGLLKPVSSKSSKKKLSFQIFNLSLFV